MKKGLVGKYLFLLVAMLVISCSDDNDFENTVNNEEASTYGIRHDLLLSDYEDIAASDDQDLPNFEAVVNFTYSLDGSDDKAFTASGTLINKEWILTAGHNFYEAESQTSPAPIAGITINFGNNPNDPDATYSVSEMVIHPSWLAGNQAYEDGGDLCLIKLSSSVSNITPVDLYVNTDEALDSNVWFCGFGDYSAIEGQDPDLYSKKHAMENVLDRKVTGLETTVNDVLYSGGLLAYDFDHPAGTINSLGDDYISENEEVFSDGTSDAEPLDYEGATVKGDSGGPLFVNDNGTWKLAGVLSGGAVDPIENHKDADYGDISIFIRVSNAIDWINTVID